ncbi:MAG: cellulase family glycosylhydrolase [Bacteroidia bacterium]|nr:cellulase family glycosylhydrolase [Bacteroidia bacterium]
MKNTLSIRTFRWMYRFTEDLFSHRRRYILFGILLAVISLGFTVLAGNAWVYFHTREEVISAFNPVVSTANYHTPKVEWARDPDTHGRKMEEETRRRITENYLSAWAEWNYYLRTGDTTGLPLYFQQEICKRIKQYKPEKINQFHFSDLTHFPQLHFYSADGQIVGFTDYSVATVGRRYNTQTTPFTPVHTEFNHQNKSVVMVLEDGFWKIRQWDNSICDKVLESKRPATSGNFINIDNQRFEYKNQVFDCRGINYYPQNSPWDMFGKNFSINTIRNDFRVIKSLNLNTVRIFVPFEDFGKGNVDMEMLSQMESLLDEAKLAELKVIVTLFDFNSDYRISNWSQTERQMEIVLETFTDREEIIAYDIKNEPDLDFRYSHRQDVLDWLSYMLKKARLYDSNHLFTIGWADPDNAHLLAGEVDFVSFHFYKDIKLLSSSIDQLKEKTGIQLLMLQEFGMSTFSAWWFPGSKTEQEQSDYYQQVLNILKEKEAMPFLSWTLYDFENVPGKVAGELPQHKLPQKKFGIINEKGKLKPAAEILKNHIIHE